MKSSWILPVLLGLGLVTWAQPVWAAQAGDPAAPLAIKEWVKGQAIDVKDGKRVYVVEFWATWCPPCRQSIPHLTELQKTFKDKDVVIVGVSGETVETVRPFVEKMGDKMNYTVACDDGNKTSRGYMEAFGQDGIPYAFVVGKNGNILWHGHPLDGLDQALEQIVAGKYDLDTVKKRDAARSRMEAYQKASSAGEPQAKELGQQLLADAGADVDALCQLAFAIVANSSNPNRDFKLANEALDKAEKTTGLKDHRVLGVRAISLFESGKMDEGIALAKEALELSKTDQDKQRYQGFLKVMENRKNAKPKP
jgi:thiol-disulfide isomerase/thioredoxin